MVGQSDTEGALGHEEQGLAAVLSRGTLGSCRTMWKTQRSFLLQSFHLTCECLELGGVMQGVGQELRVELLEKAELCRDHLLLFLWEEAGVEEGRGGARRYSLEGKVKDNHREGQGLDMFLSFPRLCPD